MKFLQRFSRTLGELWKSLVAPRPSAFTCGHCEKRDRCGLPPSEDCVTRAAQIEQGRRLPIRL